MIRTTVFFFSLLVTVVMCFSSTTLPPAVVSSSLRPTSSNNRVLVEESSESSSAWVPLDDEECLIPPEEATVEYILNQPARDRALQIAGIVLSEIIFPLSSSILTQGLPKDGDWGEFWARTATTTKGSSSNAERVTHALERLGPVYVKLGQALGARPDAIPLSLANALSKLQDCMEPFDAESAKRIVTQELLLTNKLTGQDMDDLLLCLSEAPIAAASIGQVYKGNIGDKVVAVKVQRPGIRAVMERDAALLRTLATWLESIPAPAFLLQQQNVKKMDRLIASELESAVEGFFDRIFEELDYQNEMANAAKFGKLYSNRGGTSDKAHVVVPEFYPDLCTENILVMEWLDGTKLTSLEEGDASAVAENLEVIKQAIDCTLSQLLDTGVLHADPHGGNLLKIQTSDGPRLGYLDFGLLSEVPQQVRDALVCAVAHLVFDHDSEAVAMLFGELELVPADVVEDPKELKALTEALNQTMNKVLVYPENTDISAGEIQFPELQFDQLIGELTKLVPRFKFRLPPYFLQKARALGYLEGMACSLDSDFNILQMLYPYALNRLMVNPTDSQIMGETLQNLIRSSDTGRVEFDKISKLLEESAHLTGYRKRKVIRDILKTSGGRRLIRNVVREQIRDTTAPGRRGRGDGLLLRSRRFWRKSTDDE